MNGPTGVSVHFVAALLQGVTARGFEPAPLLAQSGIAPELLATPQARVSAGAYAALMRVIAVKLDDEFFGRDSRRMKLGSFAMLCHAVIGCRRLHSALARAARCYGLMLDDIGATLQEQDGVVRLLVQDGGRGDLFAHENLLLFLHRLACWLVNRRIPVVELCLAFPRPRSCRRISADLQRRAAF